MHLSREEGRVVGCLIEKHLTTPQQYPLTLNALVLACNQTSNRDPVVSYDEATVEGTLASLKAEGLLRFVLPSHGRSVTRYRHVLHERLGLDERRLALIAVLLLRGPQTVGELRTRTARMAEFGGMDGIEGDLDRMAEGPDPLVVRLARRPGQKEERWGQLLAQDHDRLLAAERADAGGRGPRAMTPDELLTTTRAVRRRLDLERPVERAVIEECLQIALQAPSGGNRQAWHWVFVSDPAKKRAIAGHYRECFEEAYGAGTAADLAATAQRIRASAGWLADHMGEVPVLLVACQWGRTDEAPSRRQAGYWGSILPAVWSFMLALRSRGLGSAWTTLHLGREREVADLLGIPYERCAQAGLFPVAYTRGTDFRPGDRKPLGDIVHWDAW